MYGAFPTFPRIWLPTFLSLIRQYFFFLIHLT
jgi:hypothetical protein